MLAKLCPVVPVTVVVVVVVVWSTRVHRCCRCHVLGRVGRPEASLVRLRVGDPTKALVCQGTRHGSPGPFDVLVDTFPEGFVADPEGVAPPVLGPAGPDPRRALPAEVDPNPCVGEAGGRQPWWCSPHPASVPRRVLPRASLSLLPSCAPALLPVFA